MAMTSHGVEMLTMQCQNDDNVMLIVYIDVHQNWISNYWLTASLSQPILAVMS